MLERETLRTYLWRTLARYGLPVPRKCQWKSGDGTKCTCNDDVDSASFSFASSFRYGSCKWAASDPNTAKKFKLSEEVTESSRDEV